MSSPCNKLVLTLCLLIVSVFFSQAQSDEQPGVSDETIAAYPAPDVTQIYANDALLQDRIYRRVVGPATLYDAPNGNAKNTLGVGFNFVTIVQFVDGWAQISADTWVRNEVLSEEVALSRFAGILLPEAPLPYPVAWLLTHVNASAVPGGEPDTSNPFLWRYTTVNIYATVEIDDWEWYQIGVDQWVHQTKVAKVIPVDRFDDIDTERWISVDLYEQVAIAYEGNTPVFATLVSSGLPEWSTNEGLFHIYVRYPRTIMSGAEGQPDFYYLEEVPWTMYFDEDIALHGAYWHDGFGYRRSHGCVNLSVTDAHWLYEWAAEELDFTIPEDTGAAVYVYSSGDYR